MIPADEMTGIDRDEFEAARRDPRVRETIAQAQGNIIVDDEVSAMHRLCLLLEPFDGKARRRMLEWVVAYQSELPGYCLPSMRKPA